MTDNLASEYADNVRDSIAEKMLAYMGEARLAGHTATWRVENS